MTSHIGAIIGYDVTMNVTEMDIPNTTLQPQTNVSNPAELAVYVSLEICIALVAFTSNVLVIAALWKFRSLRTPTNWFVASLAVADIAVAIFAIPSAILLRFGLSVTHEECGDVTGPSVEEGMCMVIITSVIFLTQVSIFSLVLIAIDRFIAINYPFKYPQFVTKNKTRLGIVLAWVLGGFIGIAPEMGWNKWDSVETCERNKCAFEEVNSMEYMVYFNFFACVLTPLLSMGVMYLFIFRSAKKQLRKIYFDVKDLKRRHREAKARHFVENIKHAASSTIFELKNGHHGHKNNKKKFKRAQSLPPFDDGVKNHRLRTISENNGQNSQRNCSIASSCLEMGVNNNSERAGSLKYDSPAQIILEEPCSSDSYQSLPEEGSPDPNFDYNKARRCQSLPRHSVREAALMAMHLRRHYKDKSASLGENGIQSCSQDEISEDDHDISELRPHGKAHSFSASSNIKKPFRRQNSIYHFSAKPLRHIGDSSSVTSSRSTVYASEHGVWSTVDGGTHELQRKMRRKSQLLKKEFRAARSLATVVGLFAICWLPLHIMNCVTLYCPTCTQPLWLKDLAILLSHANSLVNPIIYAFKLRDFRTAFRKILAPFFVPKDNEMDSTSSSSKFGAVKWCCFVTSRNDVINELSSEDSWKGKHSHHKMSIKIGNHNTNTNNNISNSNSPHNITRGRSRGFSLSSPKRMFPNCHWEKNQTETTFISPESAVKLLNQRSASLPASVPVPASNDSSSTRSSWSSGGQLEMIIPSLNSNVNVVFNAPETVV